MTGKKTLYEIYWEINRLMEQRDLNAKLVASCAADEELESADHFIERYKWYENRIGQLSSIEVEIENDLIEQ